MELPTVRQSDTLAKSSLGMPIFFFPVITELPTVQQRELLSQASLTLPIFRLIGIME